MNRENHIGFELRILSNLIKRHIDNSAARAEIESVTGTNMWVIKYLVHHKDEEVFQKDLEQNFSVRRSTMSNILSLMEKKELITRESVPQDGRLKKLVLTEKSIQLYEMMKKDREETEELITAGLTEKEIKTFVSILEKMKKNFEEIDGPCEHHRHHKHRKANDK